MADSQNARIEVFSNTGAYLRQWGSPGTYYGDFNDPMGVAIDLNRNEVFVADTGDSRVQAFDLSGTVYHVFSGSGAGTLSLPEGLFTDQRGDLYVVDTHNHRIEQFDVDGDFVGTFGSAGAGAGQLNTPTAGAVNPKSGQIDVVDEFNNRVQRFGSPAPQHDAIGVWRPSAKTFYLRNENSTGPANISVYVPYAQSTDLPVAGDWNGDGQDSPGIYRPSNQTFYLTDLVTNGPVYATYVATLGISGDVPFTGDWPYQGSSGIGVFRPSNGVTYEKDVPNTGYADNFFIHGVAGDVPVAGQWVAQGITLPAPPPHPTTPIRSTGRASAQLPRPRTGAR